MKDTSIAVIGAGNMASALIGGIIKQNYPPQNIWVTDHDASKLEALKQRLGVNTTTDNSHAANATDAIILAVKPHHMAQACLEIADVVLTKSPLIISIAAGVPVSALKKWLGDNTRIIRCMPNTPALISKGACALFATNDVSKQERNLAESLLKATGLVIWVDNEPQIDTVTAISGSGPAYFFYIIDALEIAAIKLGLNNENAHKLAVQTAVGAAHMVNESNLSAKELQKQVTSKGGTTEAAIKIFEQVHLKKILADAVNAAKTRSEEVANSFTEQS